MTEILTRFGFLRLRSLKQVSYHERKVQIFGAVTYVDVSVLRCHWHVVEGQAEPQQAAEHAHFARYLKLKAPGS